MLYGKINSAQLRRRDKGVEQEGLKMSNKLNTRALLEALAVVGGMAVEYEKAGLQFKRSDPLSLQSILNREYEQRCRWGNRPPETKA
jgi:hypothetical protein